MSKALAVKEQQQSLLPQEPEQPNMLAVIARAAASPDVNVEKMQALLEMQRTIQKDQAQIEFNAALARIQPRLPRIPKNGEIIVKGTLRSRYALFEDIDAAIRPLLAEEGLAASFATEERDKGVRVTLDVRHRMGHVERRYFDLPIDQSDYRSAVQNVKSSVTFGKRVLLVNFFNIVEEGLDKDGVDAKPITEQQIQQLEDMLEAVAPDRAAFLKYMAVAKLSDLNQQGFVRAMAALRAKAKAEKRA